MLAIDHRFALGRPALPSAPDKKSLSSANFPISAQMLFVARMQRLHVDRGRSSLGLRLGAADARCPVKKGWLRHCEI
jgi:hypothetical protein